MTTRIGAFCREPANSVTRERIFFHRLYFDLKLAAARRGYALTLFEPEVDRDAYDVMLDDGDAQRRVQLKTVLKSAKTANWKTTKRFMRPEPTYGERINLAPLDSGIGGGFVLIEIDDDDDEGSVRYRYTDYGVMQALALALLRETRSRRGYKSFGQPGKDRADFADDFLGLLHKGGPRDEILVQRKHFVRAKGPDELLALLGLHSLRATQPPMDRAIMALEAGFGVDAHKGPLGHVTPQAKALAALAGSELLSLSEEPDLEAYVQ